MITEPLLTDVAQAIEAYAPPRLQESYDNTGWQVLCDPAGRCSGIVTCVDPTPAVVAEAVAKGCNLIVSHHPLMFRGQKSFTGSTLVQRTVMDAMRAGVSVYSCHTAIDSAPGGISAEMAAMLGLTGVSVLAPAAADPAAGLGAAGTLPAPLTPGELAEKVKGTFDVPVARCSRPAPGLEISRVALCGGSGAEFIPTAIAAGAQAYITSDVKHHDFVDFGPGIFIIDIPHWSAEACARTLFARIVSSSFPALPVIAAEADRCPVIHL
ncbi:MAG: Nif3-like dinuclear metal center hexameric protein [Bacteroides sp.]|nr:Nif3-like dinuclear metal center hexameric protein [Bacteroides sp.]